jgi:segregation and condensation protein A
MGVVVSFLAILELLKLGLIDIVQMELFGPIHLKAILQHEHENREHEYELETSFDG